MRHARLAWFVPLLLGTCDPCTVSAPAAPTTSSAKYPIPPQTARTLFAKAPLVVLAKVAAVERVEAHAPPFYSGGDSERVTLAVERAFKGTPPARLDVRCDRWVICPADAHYEADGEVIAFLTPAKIRPGIDASFFDTDMRSWGVRTVREGDREAWIAALDGLAALAQSKPEERRARELEWLVATSEQPPTRWDAAYELARECSPDAYFDHDEDEPQDARRLLQPAWRELSGAQRRRLKSALLAAATFGPGERCLERCFRQDDDGAIARWLFDRLETIANAPQEKERVRELSHLARRYLGRAAHPEAKGLAAALQAAYDLPLDAHRATALRAAFERLPPPPR